MLKSGADPSHIIREKGLAQITNEKEIEQAVQEVIAKNPKAIEDYKNGKQNALQFLIGQAMAQTRGKADPAILTKIIRSAIIWANNIYRKEDKVKVVPFRKKKRSIQEQEEVKEKWIQFLLLQDQGTKGLLVVAGVNTDISLN